jgi:predicted MFS family arabinose efflux permease
VLLSRNVGLFFAGNLTSAIGTWFQNIAQTIFIFRLTGSTFSVALVNMAQFAGVVLMSPWSGAAADRFDRRRLLITTQSIRGALALVLAVVVALDAATPLFVIAIALLMGIAFSFSTPAGQALVPLLAEAEDLVPAVAINAATFNLARAVGPVLGAAVVTTLGFTWAFGLNAASYFVLVVALLLIRPRAQVHGSRQRPRLRESLSIIRGDRRLLIPLAVVAAVAVAIDPVTTLTPQFSVDIYGRTDTFTGYLVGAFGAGAVVGVAFAGRIGRSRLTMAATSATVAIGLVGFALSNSPIVGLGAMFVTGIGYLTSVTVATTSIHMAVDDDHRGRVMAVWSVAFQGTRPLGALLDGTIAALVGLRAAALVMAAPVIASSTALVARRARRDDDPQP